MTDLYVGIFVLPKWSVGWQILWWLPSVATFAGIALVFRWFTTKTFTFIIATLLCLEIPKVLFALCTFIGSVLSMLRSEALSICQCVGIILAVIFAVTMLYGFVFGWRRMKVREITLEFDSLPEAFDGYHIAQFSDLHLGSLRKGSSFLKSVVRQTNRLNADAIVFTGDLVNVSADEATPFVPVLSTLKSKDGVFAVLGNHDYPYPFHQSGLMEESRKVVRIERQMGCQVLLNEHRVLTRGDAHLAIVGVENIGKRPFPQIGNLKEAMTGLPDDAFKVLLSHDPYHWRSEVIGETDIPLTLSGHTHAGQMRIGNWSPAKPVYPDWWGLYQNGCHQLYVNQGTGTRVPFRLGTYAEITHITLRKRQLSSVLFTHKSAKKC